MPALTESVITPLVTKVVRIHSNLFPYLFRSPFYFQVDEKDLLITFRHRPWGKDLHPWLLFVAIFIYIVNVGYCGYVFMGKSFGLSSVSTQRFEKLLLLVHGFVGLITHGGIFVFLTHPGLEHGFMELLSLEKKCTDLELVSDKILNCQNLHDKFEYNLSFRHSELQAGVSRP